MGESSRVWDVVPTLGLLRAPVRETVDEGCKSVLFLVAKSLVRRDGMPALVDQWHSMSLMSREGRG